MLPFMFFKQNYLSPCIITRENGISPNTFHISKLEVIAKFNFYGFDLVRKCGCITIAINSTCTFYIVMFLKDNHLNSSNVDATT